MGDSGAFFDPSHARVVVVGSMGAGKTTLAHALCHDGAVLQRPKTTVGCNVDIKRIADLNSRGERFIEFWDIGGHPDAAQARRMFFEGDVAFSGVMLVCDASNPRSVRQLREWVDELESAGVALDLDRRRNAASGIREAAQDRRVVDQDLEGGGRSRGNGSCVPVPVLVVRNKEDIGEPHKKGRRGKQLPPVLESASVVTVSARNLQENLFMKFFEDVFKHHTGGGVVQGDRNALKEDDEEEENEVDAYTTLSGRSDSVSWPAGTSARDDFRSMAQVSVCDQHSRRDGLTGRRGKSSTWRFSHGWTPQGRDDSALDVEGGGDGVAHGDDRGEMSTRPTAEGPPVRGRYGLGWQEAQAREKQS